MQRYQLSRRNQPATSTTPFTTPRGYLQLFFLFLYRSRSVFVYLSPPDLLLRFAERIIPCFPSFYLYLLLQISVYQSFLLSVSLVFFPRVWRALFVVAIRASVSCSFCLRRLFLFLSLWLAP